MNVTKLEQDCKKEARELFNDLKSKTEFLDLEFLDEFILVEIKQVYKAKVYKKHISEKLTKQQLNKLIDVVGDYESILINSFKQYVKRLKSND